LISKKPLEISIEMEKQTPPIFAHIEKLGKRNQCKTKEGIGTEEISQA